MSQFRPFFMFLAGAIAAAACSTTSTPPEPNSTAVDVPPPTPTEAAPATDPVEQPAADPTGKPATDPAGKPPADAVAQPVSTNPSPPPVTPTPVDHMAAPGFIACTNPRKNVCTKEYKPVCGVVDTGIRCIRAPCPSTAQQTFGNACSACADSKTSGYRAGECATPAPQGNQPELK